MQLVTLPPPPQTPLAEQIATSLLAHLNAELSRRVDYHAARYREFWDSHATPDDILAAMGPYAGIMLASAAENVDHIGRLAGIVGKEVTDFLPADQWQPRREFQPQPDGTVTLAAPDDGYDAWGRLIPVPEPPAEEPDEEPTTPEEP